MTRSAILVYISWGMAIASIADRFHSHPAIPPPRESIGVEKILGDEG
ncbi:MAG: hypothetical protein AB4352_27725 [Hormoscilla sp.]